MRKIYKQTTILMIKIQRYITMTTLDTLVNIPGNLKTAYTAAVPGTLRHVDELMTERRTDNSLGSLWFYTADGELYFMDNGKPKLAMTREADNLVLRNIGDAFTQLTSNGNYRPNQTEAERAIKASTTEVFDLSELKLKKNDDEFSSMEVSTVKYDKLNSEQRRLAERVYGKGDDFVLNMKMLEQAGIDTTRVYVLNPNYVKVHAKDSPIGRASWLGDLDYDSLFNASGRSINYDGRVRGVRREVAAEGDAPKNAVPSAPQEIKLATFDEVRAYSAQYVPDVVRKQFELGLRNLYKP